MKTTIVAFSVLTALTASNALAAVTAPVPDFGLQLPATTKHLGYDRFDDTTGKCFIYVSENQVYSDAPTRIEIMQKHPSETRTVVVSSVDAIHVGTRDGQLIVSAPRACLGGHVKVSSTPNADGTKTAKISCTNIGVLHAGRSVVSLTVDAGDNLKAIDVRNIGHSLLRSFRSDLNCRF